MKWITTSLTCLTSTALVLPPVGCAKPPPVPPSAGASTDQSIDFGRVFYDGGVVEAQRRVSIANPGPDPVSITDLRSTCGCTAPVVITGVAAPGERLEIDLTLSIQSPGHKHETVTALLSDGSIRSWRLSADVVRRETLFLAQIAVPLELRRGEASVTVYATTTSADRPPDDVPLAAPTGVRAELGPWRLVASDDAVAGAPARWSSELHVRGGRSIRDDDAIRIGGARRPAIVLALNGWPWN